ncbi:Hypothetical predicted protein [Mytilus galloprovincialis]|uniref:Tc3 transposase DNA binding domain-containing protein n=1 Tax=Mytilus galloprovincialis TaxID=29158 RepID=A0A8B6FJC0_MYTGA|nr:Hypothetical predicted protein [Mytilus galloprovincialis]
MAPHGKEMTQEEKKMVIGLSEQGNSGHKIGKLIGKISRTINKFLKNFRSRGSEEIGRSGRRKNIDLSDDRKLQRLLRTDRRQTLGEILIHLVVRHLSRCVQDSLDAVKV